MTSFWSNINKSLVWCVICFIFVCVISMSFTVDVYQKTKINIIDYKHIGSRQIQNNMKNTNTFLQLYKINGTFNNNNFVDCDMVLYDEYYDDKLKICYDQSIGLCVNDCAIVGFYIFLSALSFTIGCFFIYLIVKLCKYNNGPPYELIY